MITTEEIKAVYQRRAGIYDLSTRLYPFIGFRFEAYRRVGIEQLRLRPGDCVVDLGCGTGLNFQPLLERVGPRGKIIGVDNAPRMLRQAEKRIAAAGWNNIELRVSPMETFVFPEDVKGIFSSGALGFTPDPEALLCRAARALPEAGNLVIVDLKRPEKWPGWLFHLYFVLLGKAFAVTPDYVRGQPWKSVEALFASSSYAERYGGAVYIASGRNPLPRDTA